MLATFSVLPAYYLPTLVFIFGVIIGSFLNVYIYRFHTGKSLSGNSHCLSCTTPLRFYELFPLLSYLGLRGRCRTCSARIPSRYFWVELVTGLAFLLVTLLVVDMLLWPVLFFLLATLIVVAVYDLYHFVIPNEFVWTLGIVAILLCGYEWYILHDWWLLLGNVTSAFLAFIFFAGLWWYSGGRWLGFGDAKLAVPLAAMVGLSNVFSLLVLSFWIGAILSLLLMAYQKLQRRGQLRLRFQATPLTIKSEVPFAPFMILGFVAVYFLHANVLAVFSYAF